MLSSKEHMKADNDTTHVDVPSSKKLKSADSSTVITSSSTTNLFSNPYNTTPHPTTLPHEELQYLNLVRTIIENGEFRSDRTGTGTKSLFAPPQMRFNLSKGTLPLFTTKRVAFKAVFEELLWFLRGCTDSMKLSQKGVKIWDGNGSREALDKLGLMDRRVGDLGPGELHLYNVLQSV
jgi:thymidylate synthase